MWSEATLATWVHHCMFVGLVMMRMDGGGGNTIDSGQVSRGQWNLWIDSLLPWDLYTNGTKWQRCKFCYLCYYSRVSLLLKNLINTLRPRQNGRHFPDDTYKCIFLNENLRISIKISLKFVPKGPINKIPALVQIMAWSRPGDKPSSDPMMVRLPTYIYASLGLNELRKSHNI